MPARDSAFAAVSPPMPPPMIATRVISLSFPVVLISIVTDDRHAAVPVGIWCLSAAAQRSAEFGERRGQQVDDPGGLGDVLGGDVRGGEPELTRASGGTDDVLSCRGRVDDD